MRPPLNRTTWTDLVDSSRPTIIVPIGSCEQHGPHLPLDTDTRIAVALAERLAAERDVIVAPAVSFGASWEHDGFPGLLSLDHRILTELLVELSHSADWAAGLMFVNGHGGNVRAVRNAVRVITGEGRRALAWSPRLDGHPEADAHAGRTETSIMLAITPDVVRSPLPGPGHTGPLADVAAHGIAAVAASGILGDPSGSSADEGAQILERFTADLVAAFDGWAT